MPKSAPFFGHMTDDLLPRLRADDNGRRPALRRDPEPHVVFLDLVMPRTSGLARPSPDYA